MNKNISVHIQLQHTSYKKNNLSANHENKLCKLNFIMPYLGARIAKCKEHRTLVRKFTDP